MPIPPELPLPLDDEPQNSGGEDTGAESTPDIWAQLDLIINQATAAADLEEREAMVAKWEPGSLEFHDIFELYRQFQQHSAAYERQLENVSELLVRHLQGLQELVTEYCRHQGPETLEKTELRIKITQRWHFFRLQLDNPLSGERIEIVPELKGYHNPGRLLVYEELVKEGVQEALGRASQVDGDNRDLAKVWEKELMELETRPLQWEKLKELMSAKLTELQSEHALEEVIELILEGADEMDPRLDLPGRNIVDIILYNQLVHDLIEDFGPKPG